MNRYARLAVIPARGGSKRLPRKNILDFFGLPMIAWTIRAARETALFDRVVVSTEDAEIAEIARQAGAEVPFLRQSSFDDHAPVSDAVIACLGQATRHFGETYETVTMLMANCPMRGRDEIAAAHAAFDRAGTDFQISCFRLGWTNPWWAMTLQADGRGDRLFPDAALKRSQDLPPLYNPTGAIWIARTEALLGAGTFYGHGHRFQPMSWTAAVDIDDREDLDFAKAVFLLRQHQAGA